MTSVQLPLVLMAAAASMAAPQINQRQVVGDVISQLQPAIQQALASLTSSPRSSTRYTSAPATTSGLSGSSRFSGSSRSSPSVTSVTSSVVSQLQPSIAAAVAQALAGSRRPQPSRSSSAEPDYADGPAEYNFEYKVSDDESQNYIARQESRDGDKVTGSYNYINPAGTLVTVNYEADADGFRQETSEQKGAVQMRNIPGAWDGPLAGVDDVSSAPAPVTSSRGSSSGLSQQELIAKILATLQPRISSAVQSAVGGQARRAPAPAQTYTRPAAPARTYTRPAAPVRTYSRPAPAPVRTYTRPAPQSYGPSVSSFGQNTFTRSGAGQSGIVSSVVTNLQPKISAAVRAALAGSRGSSRSTSPPTSSIGGLFGTPGQASVSFQTPEFNVAY